MSLSFWTDWNEAIDNFRLKQLTVNPMRTYVHAEAGTGSRYEVFTASFVAQWRSVDPTIFVAVANPWDRVWTATYGSVAFPDYVLEHWRPSHKQASEVHGGDAAAVTVCINLALGHPLDEVIERARRWGSTATIGDLLTVSP